jgi:hypothetical protein
MGFVRKRDSNWFRRRWLDFRNGHSIYLIFIMTFANFVTIQYSLLIDKLPALNSIFNNIFAFAIVFVAAYVPLGMIIGYWHRKSQWKVEQEAMFRENVVGARIWLFTIKLIEGTATEEEKKNMIDFLSTIVSKKTVQATAARES